MMHASADAAAAWFGPVALAFWRAHPGPAAPDAVAAVRRRFWREVAPELCPRPDERGAFAGSALVEAAAGGDALPAGVDGTYVVVAVQDSDGGGGGRVAARSRGGCEPWFVVFERGAAEAACGDVLAGAAVIERRGGRSALTFSRGATMRGAAVDGAAVRRGDASAAAEVLRAPWGGLPTGALVVRVDDALVGADGGAVFTGGATSLLLVRAGGDGRPPPPCAPRAPPSPDAACLFEPPAGPPRGPRSFASRPAPDAPAPRGSPGAFIPALNLKRFKIPST